MAWFVPEYLSLYIGIEIGISFSFSIGLVLNVRQLRRNNKETPLNNLFSEKIFEMTNFDIII